MDDLISRAAAIDALHMDTSIIPFEKAREYADATISEIRNRLEKLPSAQPSRELIEQIKWERDLAVQQLKDLGYGLGEKPRTDEDLISRQAAIDALEREKTYCTAFCDGYTPINVFEKYNDGLTDGIKALKNLPSAQPDVPDRNVGDISSRLEKDDFGALAICAIRYCHGRQTYMPDLVRNIIRPHLKELSDKDLTVMIDDCDFQERMNLYGDERIDKPGWLRWKADLIAEKERRADDSISG